MISRWMDLTHLEIFKSLYSKIKYRKFNKYSDYCSVIDLIKATIKKLADSKSNTLLALKDPNGDESVSEYNELEKVGNSPTFDSWCGNKYTRKLYVKNVYNEYYSKLNSSPMVYDPNDKNRKNNDKSIRSHDQRDR